MVTIPVTKVNTLVDDAGNRSGYPVLMGMTYPNRLGELMKAKGTNDPALAEAIGTSKQQIFKLRRGERKLTREWAEKIAPALGVTWPEVIGWTGAPPSDDAPNRAAALQALGQRISWAISYRGLSREEAARRFRIAADRLGKIEAGEEEPGALELATISSHLRIEADFLLRGEDEALNWRVAEDYRGWAARQAS